MLLLFSLALCFNLPIMLEFIDTHCHLNHRDFDEDYFPVRARATQAGVTKLLTIGYDMASSYRAAELSQDKGMYAAIGIHPEAAAEWNSDNASLLRSMFENPTYRVVAYGEIGLDYHWQDVPREDQHRVFAAQIAYTQELSPRLPLIIHNREALEDILAILKESQTQAPVVMHCFTGDIETARVCLEAGYYLGIGGVSAFKKSQAIRDAIAFAPLDRLLLETDCPYLAPDPYRGKRNEPSYVPLIAKTVAAAKGMSIEEIAAATTANAIQLFGMR
jgi:TatD DNase family protein